MIPRTTLSTVAERTSTPAISTLMQLALATPGLISLAAGFVDQCSLPVDATASGLDALLADAQEGRRGLAIWNDSRRPWPSRSPDRRTRAGRACQRRRDQSFESRLVVTTGSQQLLYLIAEALLDPGDIVLVESPTYFVFLGVLETRGVRVIGVETDDEGLRLDALEATLSR